METNSLLREKCGLTISYPRSRQCNFTDSMWADMNTKPKQGIAYHTDRSYMMKCDIDLPIVGEVEEEPHQDVDRDSTRDSALNYRLSSPHDNCAVLVVPRVTWGSSHECVGSTERLGITDKWTRTMSALRVLTISVLNICSNLV